MKKIVLFSTIALLIFCSQMSAFAVSFRIPDCEASPNHRFTAEVIADAAFSAAVFIFDYDSSVMELRQVQAAEPFDIEYHDSGGKVTICFFNPEGAESGDSSLFTLDFLAKQEGVYPLSCTVRDCADETGAFLPIDSVSAGNLTVRQTATSSAGTKSAKGGIENVSTAPPTEDSTDGTRKSHIIPAHVSNPGLPNVLAIVGLCIGSAVISGAAVYFVSRRLGRKAKSAHDSEQQIQKK